VRDGRDKAAAQTLEEEFEGVAVVGEVGETTAAWPFRGACRCNCRAFARAFSCVRTKYARF
jgi:hypothetical protein